jgi:hypothetical protein
MAKRDGCLGPLSFAGFGFSHLMHHSTFGQRFGVESRAMLTLTLLAALALAAEDAGPGSTPSVLRNATVRTNQGAPEVARMSDGTAPVDGDVWDSQWTAKFAAGGVIEWDLGGPRHLEVMRLQADNNDTYLVATSLDGSSWTQGWVARSVGVPGMQTRTSDTLNLEARYVRLTAQGGDSKYSIGEFEIFQTTADMVGAQLKRITPPPPPPPAPFNTGYLLVIAVAGAAAWVLQRARLENLKKRAPKSAD